MTSAAPWAQLVTLAERERELALAGRWEELAVAGDARLRAAQALPTPPEAAREYLARLSVLQAQIAATVAPARAFMLRKIGSMDRGQTAVRGYGSAGRAPAAGAAVRPGLAAPLTKPSSSRRTAPMKGVRTKDGAA